MAQANRKKMGAGTQGKGAGTGAMTEVPEEIIGENMVLSNRDKAEHASGRGQDTRAVQNEQLQDQPHNRQDDER